MSVPDVLSVAEDEGTVQVCATLSLSTEVNISVTLTTRQDDTGVCITVFTSVNVYNNVHLSYKWL